MLYELCRTMRYMSYDDVWVMIPDDVLSIYIYILMNVVLDMFDALCGNMMSMMIA